MSNMSYCRFENTAQDLDDCARVLREWADDPDTKHPEVEGPVSKEYELPAARRLVATCYEIIDALLPHCGEDGMEWDEVTIDDLKDAVTALNERREKAEAKDDEDEECEACGEPCESLTQDGLCYACQAKQDRDGTVTR